MLHGEVWFPIYRDWITLISHNHVFGKDPTFQGSHGFLRLFSLRFSICLCGQACSFVVLGNHYPFGALKDLGHHRPVKSISLFK